MEELDFTEQIRLQLLASEGNEEEISTESWAAEEKKGKKLNKPFRTPGGPKKFSVYVKNEKGNVVKVNFGDPNMEIKRDDPARRRNFRARHGCDNPGPKTKAKYWSCKMWSKKSVKSVTKGEAELEDEMVDFLDESDAKGKGLWHNIREKKKRMGKNYRPAKPGDKDYPDPEALKKAQGPKKKKSKAEDEEQEKKDDKKGGLTKEQKSLPPALQKKILEKKGKASDCGDHDDMDEKSKAFKPHDMFDPKTGKAYKAKSYEDHVKYKKMGYTEKQPAGYKKKKTK